MRRSKLEATKAAALGAAAAVLEAAATAALKAAAAALEAASAMVRADLVRLCARARVLGIRSGGVGGSGERCLSGALFNRVDATAHALRGDLCPQPPPAAAAAVIAVGNVRGYQECAGCIRLLRRARPGMQGAPRQQASPLSSRTGDRKRRD